MENTLLQQQSESSIPSLDFQDRRAKDRVFAGELFFPAIIFALLIAVIILRVLLVNERAKEKKEGKSEKENLRTVNAHYNSIYTRRQNCRGPFFSCLPRRSFNFFKKGKGMDGNFCKAQQTITVIHQLYTNTSYWIYRQRDFGKISLLQINKLHKTKFFFSASLQF